MARLARVVLPGHPHHITQRGVRSMPVFFNDEDRHEYLRLLRKQGDIHGVRYIAYCLMTNHVHLVAIPETETAMARAIGEAHRLYTRMINFREGVRGYLFQGRFFSCPLDEKHLYAVLRYVERNPVRAKIVKHAWDYSWSSAQYHVGHMNNDPLIIGNDLLADIKDWGIFLSEEDDDLDKLRKKTRTGRPLGSSVFITEAERLTKRVLRFGKSGRPKKKAEK